MKILVMDSVTAADIRAEQAKRDIHARIRKRIERRFAGTAGDMTASLPGFEGVSDVPLFTEVTL